MSTDLNAVALTTLAELELGKLSEAFDAWRQDPATAELYLDYLIYDPKGFPVLLSRQSGSYREVLLKVLDELRWMIAYRHKTFAPCAGASAEGCHFLFTVGPDEWQGLEAAKAPAHVSVWLVGHRQDGFPIGRLGAAPAGLDPGAWALEALSHWASTVLSPADAPLGTPPTRDGARFQLQIDLASPPPPWPGYETAAMRLRRRVRERWRARFESKAGRGGK